MHNGLGRKAHSLKLRFIHERNTPRMKSQRSIDRHHNNCSTVLSSGPEYFASLRSVSAAPPDLIALFKIQESLKT
jgi:hypothetical protein